MLTDSAHFNHSSALDKLASGKDPIEMLNACDASCTNDTQVEPMVHLEIGFYLGRMAASQKSGQAGVWCVKAEDDENKTIFFFVGSEDKVGDRINALSNLKDIETIEQLIRLVSHYAPDVAGKYYDEHGPTRREQEDHYTSGVSVVDMNVKLLEGWLNEPGSNAALKRFCGLPREARRKVWEASGFHFGLRSYRKRDANYYWETQP